MKLILGSSSKWRAKVLESAGIHVDGFLSPDIDEKAIRHADPERLVLALAHAKADALLPRIQEPVLLITVDQVVVCQGEIREKPKDVEEARVFLSSYIDHPAEAISGVVVTNTATGARAEGVDRASVLYKPSLKGEIENILKHSFAMESSGALVAENPLMLANVKESVGTPDSFMGMPVALVKSLMAKAAGG
ncbi:Maf family protein [Candidatus Uhrbacteria bacterium]|nr:Maf family protein [Candidatus Uhrbacteria bacterium]